ncbi:MAG: hypothetical protein K9G11_00065 [Rickettsiaceae bacterium]|nr:hypothetical protein [Rickettsiaceae bacterium]
MGQRDDEPGNAEFRYWEQLNLLEAAQEQLKEAFQERCDEAGYLLALLGAPAGLIPPHLFDN